MSLKKISIFLPILFLVILSCSTPLKRIGKALKDNQRQDALNEIYSFGEKDLEYKDRKRDLDVVFDNQYVRDYIDRYFVELSKRNECLDDYNPNNKETLFSVSKCLIKYPDDSAIYKGYEDSFYDACEFDPRLHFRKIREDFLIREGQVYAKALCGIDDEDIKIIKLSDNYLLDSSDRKKMMGQALLELEQDFENKGKDFFIKLTLDNLYFDFTQELNDWPQELPFELEKKTRDFLLNSVSQMTVDYIGGMNKNLLQNHAIYFEGRDYKFYLIQDFRHWLSLITTLCQYLRDMSLINRQFDLVKDHIDPYYKEGQKILGKIMWLENKLKKEDEKKLFINLEIVTSLYKRLKQMKRIVSSSIYAGQRTITKLKARHADAYKLLCKLEKEYRYNQKIWDDECQGKTTFKCRGLEDKSIRLKRLLDDRKILAKEEGIIYELMICMYLE
ncbi:MAG: hypothetical protein ABIA04_06850 [Pseudomonadota bacterium]